MTQPSTAAQQLPRQLAVIVNPTKVDDLEEARTTVTKTCADAGWAEPLWIETTEDDPGRGQARQALEQGAALVCPLGGDGTVRAVASALVGTDVPLGLLPAGTGNLLARNLGLPVTSVEQALAVALTGSDRRIDVGMVRLDDGEEEVFLVMAGMGLDADVMAGTNERVKAKVGWAAYLLEGVRHLWGPRFAVQVTVDGRRTRQHSRAVIIGNCGTLQGGLQLIPDAMVDDGRLDALILSPQGALGWAAVVSDLATRHHRGHQRLVRLTFESVDVRTARAVETQLDGDPAGARRALSARAEPRSLVVRVG